MSPSSRCPADRSELVSVLEDHASETLRTHVAGCERCQLEVGELRSALDLLSPTTEARPSERIRREALSYARSQVPGSVPKWTPWRATGARTPWRAAAAAVIGVALALSFGQLAEAGRTSLAPEIMNPEPWTLVLAAAWGLASFLYAAAGVSTIRREIVTRALAGASAFTLLALVLPIPTVVEFCSAWVFGPGPLTPVRAFEAYAVVATLYASVPVALVGGIRNTALSRSEACAAACVFAVLTGPLLLVQAAAHPSIAGPAGIGGLLCGAWMAGLVGSRHRDRTS